MAMYEGRGDDKKKGGNSKEAPEQSKEDIEYNKVAAQVLSSVPAEDREYFGKAILGNQRTRQFYNELRSHGVSEREAVDYLKHGAARLESEGEGKPLKMNRADFYKAVGESIVRDGYHEDALAALEKDGYIKPDERKEFSGRIQKKVASRLEHMARAAVWLFMVIGAILMLVSGYSMTGAVIGSESPFAFSFLFVIGFVLFVGGLILSLKKS